MHRSFLKISFFLAALAVALGAFGAHALKNLVSANAVATFETGVRYQFYHVFALSIAAILYKYFPSRWLFWAGVLFIAGIVLFSGSLYILTYFTALVKPPITAIAILTPIGGLAFIVAWVFLFIGVTKK